MSHWESRLRSPSVRPSSDGEDLRLQLPPELHHAVAEAAADLRVWQWVRD